MDCRECPFLEFCLEEADFNDAEAWEEVMDNCGYEEGIAFAEPGGRSALRAETDDNPRNLPCPTCGTPNQLTPKDVELGYQCDACADALELGGP